MNLLATQKHWLRSAGESRQACRPHWQELPYWRETQNCSGHRAQVQRECSIQSCREEKEVIWLAQMYCPSGPFLLVHLLGA